MRKFAVWFLGFVALETVLFAVSAMVDPHWASAKAILLFCLGCAILMFALAVQNRPKIADWVKGDSWASSRWLDLDTSFRTFRDFLGNDGHVGGVLDFWEGDGRGYFLSYMRDGLNRGLVSARGTPKNGLKVRNVPTPVRDLAVEDNRGHDFIVGSDDREYHELEFDSRTLRKYAEWIESDNNSGGGSK